MKSNCKKRGFTIIELLVVCAIIAILVLIVIISFDRSKMRTRDAQRKADLTKIAAALESYHADQKIYPISSSDNPPLFTSVPNLTSLINGGYIIGFPNDPIYSDTTHMYYKYASDTSQYKLLANSETVTNDESDADAQMKAGDFYNPPITTPEDHNEKSCFQISSSKNALESYWINGSSAYCD